MATSPKLALIGAFPFPLPQGSQVYFEAQARALGRAGADCTLMTYGRGRGESPEDLDVVALPEAAMPRHMRSGPSLGKPLADAALLQLWLRQAKRKRFDAVLAHNAEAAAVALAARPMTGVPVIYVAHTLLGHELSAYLPRALARPVGRMTNAVGAKIDRLIAQRADGILVLCNHARDHLAPHARGPIAVIPPGLDATCLPESTELAAACKRHGLEPGRFHLYTGNFDGYQDLDLLDAATAMLGPGGLPVVVASHDAAGVRDNAKRLSHLHCITVPDFEEARLLCAAATSLLLTRRRVGGFPIKLLNYMEAMRPIVAFADVAEGLVHVESGWLLGADDGPTKIAEAMNRLASDPTLASKLGRGARKTLEKAHAWPALAGRTLDLVDEVIRQRTGHSHAT